MAPGGSEQTDIVADIDEAGTFLIHTCEAGDGLELRTKAPARFPDVSVDQ